MRCPNCNAWATPDINSCGECGTELKKEPPSPAAGGSVLDKYKQQIHSEREGRKSPFGRSGGAFDRTDEFPVLGGSVPSVPAIERAMAEEISLDADSIEVLNLLLLHAGFSPFKRVAVRSSSRDGLSGTRLRVSASPAVIKPLTVSLADLAENHELDPPLASPDQDEFFRLDEAVRGQLDLAVMYEDTALTETSLSVTVQTANEWIGIEGVEASLACLVTPNAPSVIEMVAKLSGDFAAYQAGDVRRVVREVEEVYEGIRRLGLSYIGVPPSFEGTGQKVLFPDEVISSKRGCCIDIAVLTASLLERIGYNPLVVVITGHAYSGVWTSDIRSKTPVIRDVDVIRQAIDDGDLVVWNSTTYFDRGGDDGIANAVEIGVQMLDEFEYAIDIAACRAHDFKPLPRRRA
jgi:hypothetical protein